MKIINSTTDADVFPAEHFRQFSNLLSASGTTTPRWPKLEHPRIRRRRGAATRSAFEEYLLALEAWLSQAKWFGSGFYAQAREPKNIIFAIRPSYLSGDWHVFIFDPLTERGRLNFPTLLGAAHFVLTYAQPIHLLPPIRASQTEDSQ